MGSRRFTRQMRLLILLFEEPIVFAEERQFDRNTEITLAHHLVGPLAGKPAGFRRRYRVNSGSGHAPLPEIETDIDA